jgi:hypothetical protein
MLYYRCIRLLVLVGLTVGRIRSRVWVTKSLQSIAIAVAVNSAFAVDFVIIVLQISMLLLLHVYR